MRICYNNIKTRIVNNNVICFTYNILAVISKIFIKNAVNQLLKNILFLKKISRTMFMLVIFKNEGIVLSTLEFLKFIIV